VSEFVKFASKVNGGNKESPAGNKGYKEQVI